MYIVNMFTKDYGVMVCVYDFKKKKNYKIYMAPKIKIKDLNKVDIILKI